MICKKCRKEFPDDFYYCPYCGQKTIIPRSTVTNYEYLMICPDEFLQSEVEKLKAVETAKIRDYLSNLHETVFIYRIKGDTHRKRSTGVDISKDVFIEWRDIKRTKRDRSYSIGCLYSVKTPLIKSNVSHIGEDVFWTKKEAELCIEKMKAALKEVSDCEL